MNHAKFRQRLGERQVSKLQKSIPFKGSNLSNGFEAEDMASGRGGIGGVARASRR